MRAPISFISTFFNCHTEPNFIHIEIFLDIISYSIIMPFFKGPPLASNANLLSLVGFLAIIFLLFSPVPSAGNPLTKKQFMQVIKLLEAKVQETYPSDAEDAYSDLVMQSSDENKKETIYHLGDPAEPVIVVRNLANIKKKVHVLNRGEDYHSPRDRHNFMVLLQQSGKDDQYSVHLAHVVDIQNIENSQVNWMDGRVEQQKDLGDMLLLVGNPEVQSMAIRTGRPKCDWLGSNLLCNAAKFHEPLRERAIREPIDQEDTAPVRLIANSDEVESSGPAPAPAPPTQKRKRMTGIGAAAKNPTNKESFSVVKASKNPVNEMAAQAEIGDGVDDEEEEVKQVVLNRQESKAPGAAAPVAPAQKPTPSASKKAEIISPEIASATASKKGEVEDEAADPSKKRHKRKHKPKHKKE